MMSDFGGIRLFRGANNCKRRFSGLPFQFLVRMTGSGIESEKMCDASSYKMRR
jgi:hypothetical protein